MPASLLNLQECKDLFKEAQTQFSRRKALFNSMENMFFLVDSTLPSKSWIRKIISPDPRNFILGAVRLLTSTRPKWRVPRTTNAESMNNVSDQIESVCDAINYISGQISGRPVEVEAALSAMIYGEVQIKTINTKALLDMQTGSGPKKTRAQYANMRSPLLFDCVNPKIGYPLFDSYGLSTYGSEEKVMVDFVRSRFGEELLKGKNRTDKVNLYELFNDATHAVWCDGEDAELILEPNPLGFIPVFSEIVEGSDFFVEESQSSRQPLLYGYAQSGLWNAQNMSLTIMSSLALSIVGTPMMKLEQGTPQDTVTIERSEVPWGTAIVPPGAKFDVLIKQVIDPSIPRINDMAEQKGMESSIYRTSMGQPLGNNASFSMLSLATSAARLPLVPYQRCISHVLGNAMYNGLLMLKAAGVKQTTLQGPEGPVSFDFSTLPDSFILECDLEISVPQDDRESVALAVQATQGENPLVSMEYARQTWMKMGQSGKEQKQIWKEQRLLMLNSLELKAQAAQAEKQAAASANQGGVTTVDGNTTMPEVGPGGARGLAAISPQTLGKNSIGLK